RQGVDEFVHRAADLMETARREAPDRPGYVLHRPFEVPFTVVQEADDAWRVEGVEARRAVAFADLTQPEAAAMAAERLARLGVDRALAEAGAHEGDEVRIGDLAFEYEEPGEGT
ncbi:MAG: Obg family GTPase CgtA, partial [Actinomycetota bacterium]